MKNVCIAYFRRRDGTYHGIECETAVELLDVMDDHRILWIDEVGVSEARGSCRLRRTLSMDSREPHGYRMLYPNTLEWPPSQISPIKRSRQPGRRK